MNLDALLKQISPRLSPEDLAQKELVMENLKERYKDYSDPWGFDINKISKNLGLLLPIYRKYFRVRVFGLENVEDIPYIVTSNHTGQLPLDGMLISIAMAYELPEKPRVLHSMVERFLAALPFLGSMAASSGAILGDRDNCKWLLEKGESILVFPEGVRGISKNTPDYYKLQKFTNGFFRIALQTKTPILPISVIGAEEMYPLVYHAKPLAKLLGLPSLPISANILPLPSPIDIYIGKPYYLPEDLSYETAPDSEIRKHVYQIEKEIKKNLNIGLKSRRPLGNLLDIPWLKKKHD